MAATTPVPGTPLPLPATRLCTHLTAVAVLAGRVGVVVGSGDGLEEQVDVGGDVGGDLFGEGAAYLLHGGQALPLGDFGPGLGAGHADHDDRPPGRQPVLPVGDDVAVRGQRRVLGLRAEHPGGINPARVVDAVAGHRALQVLGLEPDGGHHVDRGDDHAAGGADLGRRADLAAGAGLAEPVVAAEEAVGVVQVQGAAVEPGIG